MYSIRNISTQQCRHYRMKREKNPHFLLQKLHFPPSAPWESFRFLYSAFSLLYISAAAPPCSRILFFFTLRTVFVPMRSFFVSRCSFQFMKLLFPPFFYFPKSLHNQNIFFPGFLEKNFFFQDFWKKNFFPGFLESAFHTGRLYFKNLF